MTTTVLIQFDDGSQHQVVLSDEAKEAVRFSFNPSGIPGANRLKALSGAFITLCNELSLASGASREFPGAGREFSVAKTEMQTASMWAVLGATKELKPAALPTPNQSRVIRPAYIPRRPSPFRKSLTNFCLEV